MNRQKPKMNIHFQKITSLPASFLGHLWTQRDHKPSFSEKEKKKGKRKVQSPLYIKNQANKANEKVLTDRLTFLPCKWAEIKETSEQSFPVAEWKRLVQIRGICWGALGNNRSPDKHQWGWTEQRERKKHCKGKLEEKKQASRLPLTEIDLSKLNTRTVVVSSLFFFLLLF